MNILKTKSIIFIEQITVLTNIYLHCIMHFKKEKIYKYYLEILEICYFVNLRIVWELTIFMSDFLKNLYTLTDKQVSRTEIAVAKNGKVGLGGRRREISMNSNMSY